MMTVEDGRITRVEPDRQDPFSRGHLCPKGPAMTEVLEDPDRLRHPLRRTEAGWQRVSWDEALDEAGQRIQEVQAAHGRDGMAVYVGNPTVHQHATAIVLQGFLKALHTKNRFDANSQDANPKLLSCMQMFGDQLAIAIPDVDRTDYMLMIGANPAASNGSLMTLGDVRGRLKGIAKRGARLVLIDPRRTETAAWATEHHFIRPGADALFLLGVLNVIFTQGLADAAACERERGAESLKTLALRFPPTRVAGRCGMAPATIETIARDLAAAPRAVVYGRIGTSLNEFGTLASWLIDALNVVTGNLDRPGGAMFTSPAVDVAKLGRQLVGNRYARWRSRVRGLPELGGQLPASVMAEEMETEGPGQIRGLVTFAGNPVLSTANGERLARALSKLDFMVSVDFYVNETTRHAHLILPPTHALEQGHYDLVFHALAVRNGAKYSEPVVSPAPDAKEDWEILYELAMRLGGLDVGFGPVTRALRLAHRFGKRLEPDTLLDWLLRSGPYGDRFRARRPGLSLAKLRANPHGIDLGPLVPCRQDRVRTRDGRVDLAPDLLMDDVPRLEAWLNEERDRDLPLTLIGRRHLRTNNSWMHNVRSLVKGPDRSQLFVHPEDAAKIGVTDGGRVVVHGRGNQIEAIASVTEDVMPGVVSLPHGYGHHAAKDTLRVAGALAGPNVNAVTDEERVDPLSGVAALNGTPVRVEVARAPSDVG